MDYVFNKLVIDALVSSNGSVGFSKLMDSESPQLPIIPALNALGLPTGTYELTVRSFSEGIEPSDESKAVKFFVR